MSLREDLLSIDDRGKVVTLNVPEWGRSLHLRVLTGAERDALEATTAPDPKGRKNLANFRGRFAALVISDEAGKRVFTDADAIALGQKSAVVLDRILEAGMAHNGMDAKAVADAEGKSASGQSSDSGTSSP